MRIEKGIPICSRQNFFRLVRYEGQFRNYTTFCKKNLFLLYLDSSTGKTQNLNVCRPLRVPAPRRGNPGRRSTQTSGHYTVAMNSVPASCYQMNPASVFILIPEVRIWQFLDSEANSNKQDVHTYIPRRLIIMVSNGVDRNPPCRKN